ncbi:MAG: hypothetical protein HYR84_12980 [Planctomycetes bacterium]|nr:hypothetical protein [Planctomycetota bacterium]
MNLDALIVNFFRNVGINVPALAMLVIGIVVTQANRHRHPDAARWALAGFILRLCTDLVGICWHSVGFFLLIPNIPWLGDHELELLFVLSCLEALAYLFFLIALNAIRTPYRTPQYYDDFDDDKPPPGPSAEAPRAPKADGFKTP